MKTITICGSMRFSAEMQTIAFELEAVRGYNVLQCTYNTADLPVNAQMLDRLEAAHLRKIQLSDAIYVVDVGGYIGQSVTQEIQYAQALGKEILYYSEEKQRGLW